MLLQGFVKNLRFSDLLQDDVLEAISQDKKITNTQITGNVVNSRLDSRTKQ